MADVQAMVNEKINGKKVMVFSKSYCPYCTMAKEVLNKLNLSSADYEIMELDNVPNGDKIQEVLKKMTGASSVPRVFIKGKCIGGGTETKNMGATKLKAMLA